MDTHERSVATTSALTVVVSATVSKNWLGAQCVDYTDDGGIGDTMHASKVKYPWWWPAPTWRAGRACHIAVRPPRKCGAETAVSRNTIWQVCVCMQGTKGRDEREEGEDKEEKETNARNTNKHNAIPLPQAVGDR